MRKVLVVALLLVATSCFADSFEIFQVDGTLSSVATSNILATFTGTIEIDTTTGSVVSCTISIPSVLGLAPRLFTTSDSKATIASFGGGTYFDFNLDNRYDLYFLLDKNTLVGFTGSAFQGNYSDTVSGANFSVSGTMAPAVAPEPSTVFLIGGGLAGIFVVRRKLSGDTPS